MNNKVSMLPYIFFFVALIAIDVRYTTSYGAELSETYVYGIDISGREGCERARERLKQRAIMESCGSLLAGTKLRESSEHRDALTRLYVEQLGGKIAGYVEMNEPEFGNHSCTVQATVDVICDLGSRDPSFLPNAGDYVTLNKYSFIAGDPMTVTIDTPGSIDNQHFFLNIATIHRDERSEEHVSRVFPNEVVKKNRVSFGARLVIPEEGYTIKTSLNEGFERSTETLLILFTKEAITLPPTLSLEGLNRVLTEISLNDRRELFIAYQVTRSD